MSVTVDQAIATRDALGTAALLVSPRALRYELGRRAREWRHVCALLTGDEDEAVIELAGAVVPGMEVLMSTGFWPVMRVLSRDQQVTLHIEDDMGLPKYLNLYGPTSPVVVRA